MARLGYQYEIDIEKQKKRKEDIKIISGIVILLPLLVYGLVNLLIYIAPSKPYLDNQRIVEAAEKEHHYKITVYSGDYARREFEIKDLSEVLQGLQYGNSWHFTDVNTGKYYIATGTIVLEDKE